MFMRARSKAQRYLFDFLCKKERAQGTVLFLMAFMVNRHALFRYFVLSASPLPQKQLFCRKIDIPCTQKQNAVTRLERTA